MALIDDAYALFFQPFRAIGFIVPDVVLEETHRDLLAITDHPVEKGAAITDHAFKLPAELEVRCGWSDSTAGVTGYANEVYQLLLALQASRQPFSVSTGKRLYSDMLIKGIIVTTDPQTEHVLMVTCGLRQIIIAETQSTGMSAMSSQASPAKTAATVSKGVKQLASASSGRVAGPV